MVAPQWGGKGQINRKFVVNFLWGRGNTYFDRLPNPEFFVSFQPQIEKESMVSRQPVPRAGVPWYPVSASAVPPTKGRLLKIRGLLQGLHRCLYAHLMNG